MITKGFEMSNADKLKNMNPTDFILELQNCAFIADTALKETQSQITPDTYKTLNPRNQVLANGIFFKNMFHKYIEFLDIKLNDVQLQIISNETNDFPKISKEEYNKMPKRYRGVFIPFDRGHYVLHSQDEVRPVVSTRKTDRQKLEFLLDYARKLIPVIYQTKWIDFSTQHDLKDVKKPDFYDKHSLVAKFVSNRQLETVTKLRKIFMDIDDITRIYMKEILINKYDNMSRHGAIDIYNEYQNELTNKNRYTNAQNAINNAKAEKSGLEYLVQNAYQDDKKGLEILLKRAVKNYEIDRNKIIAGIKNNRTR